MSDRSGAPLLLSLLGLAVFVLCVSPGEPRAQEEATGLAQSAVEPAPVSDPTDRGAVAGRLETVTRELEEARQAASGRANEPGTHAARVRERLATIEGYLARQIALIDRLEGLGAPPEPSLESEETSIFALNALLELRLAAQRQAEREVDALERSRDALESARETLDAAERSRRKAKQALAESSVRTERGAREVFELAVLSSRVAAEEVNLRTLENRLARSRSEEPSSEVDWETRILALRARLARGEGDSAAGFADLTRRDAELRGLLEAYARRLSTVELRLSAAGNRYAEGSDPSTDLLVEVDALTARRDAVRLEIELLEAHRERIASQRDLWSAWERLIASEVSRDEAEAIALRARELRDSLTDVDLRLQGRMADLQIGLDAIETRISDSSIGPRAKSALEEQRRAFERLLGRQRAEAGSLAMERRVADRIIDEVDLQTGRIDLAEQLARAGRAARDLWNYEITVVDDSPITVGSLVLAIVLFGIGLWASRRGASFVGHLATKRLSLDPGAANALQTLSFYLLLVSFGLLALRAVHFPLTAFTVLGGALAIGIGFGSQNVMNNFISGLILMLERPVRTHDLVEIDGNHGTIERIGARSTQIRATDGRFIIVPNSFFLESNVVNWTLSDDLMRTNVVVGVIYGSPTRLVEELIRQVVDEEEKILPNPEPIILFEEFGDNSLNFSVHFWLVARSPMASKRVASHVRFRIDDLFREHGLVIAFPQRDVHVDSVSPIEVRLVDGGGEDGDATDAAAD